MKNKKPIYALSVMSVIFFTSTVLIVLLFKYLKILEMDKFTVADILRQGIITTGIYSCLMFFWVKKRIKKQE